MNGSGHGLEAHDTGQDPGYTHARPPTRCRSRSRSNGFTHAGMAGVCLEVNGVIWSMTALVLSHGGRRWPPRQRQLIRDKRRHGDDEPRSRIARAAQCHHESSAARARTAPCSSCLRADSDRGVDRCPLRRHADGRVSTWIEAPPEHVWRLVSDIGLMPRLSRELQSVEWLDGSPSPPSAHDSSAAASTTRWESGPPRPTSSSTPRAGRSHGQWRIPSSRARRGGSPCTPGQGGTTLSQWVRLGPGPSGLSIAIDQMPDKEQKIVFVRMREFEESMTRALAAIKALAEQA